MRVRPGGTVDRVLQQNIHDDGTVGIRESLEMYKYCTVVLIDLLLFSSDSFSSAKISVDQRPLHIPYFPLH